MGPHALEQRLRQLEAIHRSLGEQIAALRLMQEQYGLGNVPIMYSPPEPYGQTPGLVTGDPAPYSLSAPAAQPELQAEAPAKPAAQPSVSTTKPNAKKPLPKRMTGSATKEQFEEARDIIMEGYILEKPEDADRMLKTLVFRILDGVARGIRDADLPSARIAAMYLIEQAGLNPGPGFHASKLRSLLKRYVRFEPITSLRRRPR
jgi:hypothetical protein